MAPRLHIAVVPDSVMVSAGRVGESFGAIRARIGLLAGAVHVSLSVNRSSHDTQGDVLDILMRFEVELGRETLTAIRTDNRA